MTRLSTLCGLLLTAALTCPLPAHGPGVPATPPPPPFAGAQGGATPDYTGATGGATPEAPGPKGGVTPAGPTQGPGDGGTTSDPAPRSTPRTSRGLGGAAPARGGLRAKPKDLGATWKDLIGVAWKPVFLPTADRGAYQGRTLEPAQALGAGDAKAAWPRRQGRCALVVRMDTGNPRHVRALERLEARGSFVAAASLFDCYRVDLAGSKTRLVTLTVHRTDGTKVGEVSGLRRLRRVEDIMQRVYRLEAGGDLRESGLKATEALEGLARCREGIRSLEKMVICDDCGRTRKDVVARIAEYRRAAAGWEAALDRLGVASK